MDVNMESNIVDMNINVTTSVANVNVNMQKPVDFNFTNSNEICASARKIKKISSSRPKLSSNIVTGYRFIDLEILNIVVSTLRCPECMSSKLFLSENENKRKGLASCLYVNCCVCDY